jgi:hypothetical protein
MAYSEPTVTIVRVSASGETATTVLRFEIDSERHKPLAPAGLYVAPVLDREVFQLHRLVSRNALVCTFETYDAHRLPEAGRTYLYRAWWLPWAMEAALAPEADWVRDRHPYDEGCERCLFTWKPIAASEPSTEAYRSRHGWVTVEAYDKFIRNDFYRLRRYRAQ